tara:strand:- start:1024 stop:2727 length:1704 start_codon:yes stop_codon:yes gene_type:complete
MTNEIRKKIDVALKSLYGSNDEIKRIQIEINRTSDRSHGDFYSNIAMKLAKILKKSPMTIAEEIADRIETSDSISEIRVASPGYINFLISTQNTYDLIDDILNNEIIDVKEENTIQSIHVEYVSANPTGPLHIGHGRGMILGEITARFLSYKGHKIKREYYVNDAGRQIDLLLVSVLLKHMGIDNHTFIDEKENEDGHLLTYKGNYINDVAISLRDILEEFDVNLITPLLDKPIDNLISYIKSQKDYLMIRKSLVDVIINEYIQEDLDSVNIKFDSWYRESDLYSSGLINDVLSDIERKNLSYKRDGALWFKNSDFGEDKDRVLIKNNGDMTYFATDIAYHIHKLKNYDILVDIWGADHHDYATRLQTALKALGYDVENRLKIHLVQFANLSKSGVSISMSTRSGTFYPIKDLVEDIGEDATKFFYLTKKKEQHLEFDIEQAKEKNKDNPIYYIQYAHARITKMLKDLDENKISDDDYNNLNTKKEGDILEYINKYQDTFERAINNIRPDIITNYLYKLAKAFHSYYAETKIITSSIQGERVKLVKCVDTIILKGLKLLDIKPLDSM